MHKITCLLRTHRLKLGLTQQDLSALVPRTGHNRVSYVERGKRPPNAREIVAYQVIFDTLPEEIFPSVVSEVEEGVARKAYRFHQKLIKDRSEAARHKRKALEAIIARAAKSARARGK
jgi:transcriptional regulator with XRE-family HTH domain